MHDTGYTMQDARCRKTVNSYQSTVHRNKIPNHEGKLKEARNVSPLRLCNFVPLSLCGAFKSFPATRNLEPATCYPALHHSTLYNPQSAMSYGFCSVLRIFFNSVSPF